MKAILRRSCQSVKATAATLGVPYQRFADALNTNEPQPFNVDWLEPFLQLNGDEPLKWLAQRRGYVLTAQPGSAVDLLTQIVEDLEVLKRCLVAEADGPDRLKPAPARMTLPTPGRSRRRA
jgi:UDP:flavonoid glycosyltransferase YjiC (YdhE family)